MKYKVCDRVKIKGLDWYNANKNAEGNVMIKGGFRFTQNMTVLCGKEAVVEEVNEELQLYGILYDGFRFYLDQDCIESVVD